MSLRRAWRDLNRSTVAAAPAAYGVYELGDSEGDSLGMAVGVVRDELKEELAYGDAERVRWIEAASEAHAERLVREHA